MDASTSWRKTARNPRELKREVEALRLLGPACVELLDVEGDDLLLERVQPGTALPEDPDDAATTTIARVLMELWTRVPLGCTLPTVAQECAPIYDPAAVAPLPRHVVAAAQRQLERLLADAHEARVLHGDLHHGNLLWSELRGWVAIDPHGVVGDPGYDVGPLLINPWDGNPAVHVDRRLELLTELLAMPTERLSAWGLVRAVLAEAWMVQDTGRVDGGPLRVAETLLHR